MRKLGKKQSLTATRNRLDGNNLLSKNLQAKTGKFSSRSKRQNSGEIL
jgi:hypothetical protein